MRRRPLALPSRGPQSSCLLEHILGKRRIVRSLHSLYKRVHYLEPRQSTMSNRVSFARDHYFEHERTCILDSGSPLAPFTTSMSAPEVGKPMVRYCFAIGLSIVYRPEGMEVILRERARSPTTPTCQTASRTIPYNYTSWPRRLRRSLPCTEAGDRRSVRFETDEEEDAAEDG